MPKLKIDKSHYRFNPHTLKYEKIVRGWGYYAGIVLGYIGIGAAFGVLFFFIYTSFMQSPQERQLADENNRLRAQYKVLSHQLDDALKVMDDICERDENFYRVILETDSLPKSLRTGNYDFTARYDKWNDMRASAIVKENTKKMDILNRMLYVQSASFDELVKLAQQSEDRLKHIPAIQPVLNKDLKRTASGYGRRMDPIYQTIRFHNGMDFSAPAGTEIYATGDGVVSTVKTAFSGYGMHVKIDHGFGYESVYAHMSKFNCKVGQKVKRGDIIGFVGSTGTSTAPHLHYEVQLKGKKVNPQFYYFQEDLTPEEYERMIEISVNSNRTFD